MPYTCASNHERIITETSACPLCTEKWRNAALRAKGDDLAKQVERLQSLLDEATKNAGLGGGIENQLFFIGWTAIANALGVSRRIAQEFVARHGMPVAILKNGKTKKAVAARSELEFWWARQFLKDKMPARIRTGQRGGRKPIKPLMNEVLKNRDCLARHNHWLTEGGNQW